MKNTYKAVLKVLGKEWTHEGATLDEALDFGLSWEEIKGKGVITVSNGNSSHEHLFNAVKIRRILSNKTVRAQWAKMLELYLK
jgi:hypothetical protein